jgi:hypothetical protein
MDTTTQSITLGENILISSLEHLDKFTNLAHSALQTLRNGGVQHRIKGESMIFYSCRPFS